MTNVLSKGRNNIYDSQLDRKILTSVNKILKINTKKLFTIYQFTEACWNWKQIHYYNQWYLMSKRYPVLVHLSAVRHHRTVWVGRHFQDHQVPSPYHGHGQLYMTRLFRAPSNLPLSTFRNGTSTASLNNLCLTIF